MARFHIARISFNPHQAMYDELAAALAHGLAGLGHECTVAANRVAEGAVNLLLGSALFAAGLYRLRSRLDGIPYILYQLEQLDDRHGLLPAHPAYGDLLAGAAALWDYAPSSAAYLRRRGLSAAVVPPFYHPRSESFRPAADPDMDVVLAGSAHPRRLRVLEALAAAGLKVSLLQGVYGRERDALIAKARVVLNIHAWDGIAALETVRLSHLLANRCFVLSETGDHDPYEGGVAYADYEALAAACRHWCAAPAAERAAVAERGHQALRRQDAAAVLAPAVARLGDLAALAAPRSASLIWPDLAGCASEEEVLALLRREGFDSRNRLVVLGGPASYDACRAALERDLAGLESCGALALIGVGVEPGVTRLHAELGASHPVLREFHAQGTLRLWADPAYNAATISSVERIRAMRGNSFAIE